MVKIQSLGVTINLNNINDNTPELLLPVIEIQPVDSLNYCYVDENIAR